MYKNLISEMKTLPRSDIPEDFVYYRTGSRVFLDYYKEFTKLKIIETGQESQFIKAGKITEKFYSVIAEKVDTEPSKAFLAKYGISHGMVFWMPMRRIEKPK
jgi:hypothetical protein